MDQQVDEHWREKAGRQRTEYVEREAEAGTAGGVSVTANP